MSTHDHSDEHPEREAPSLRLRAVRLLHRIRREAHTRHFVVAGLLTALVAGSALATMTDESAQTKAERVAAEPLDLVQSGWPVDTVIDEIAAQRDTATSAIELAEVAVAEKQALDEAEAQAQAEAAEAAAQAEAEAEAAAAAEAAKPDWISPSDARITSHYGERWGRLHAGMDFANWYDDPIWAIGDGTVTYAGWMDGYGHLVVVDHGDGVETAYGHASEVLVSVGDEVEQGDHLSLTGNTGNSTGPHLHFEVRIDGVQVDPYEWLGDHDVDLE